jgi:hypothetical protein
MAELDLVEGIENGMADRSLWAGGQILHLFRGCGMSPYSGDNRVEDLRHDTRAGSESGNESGNDDEEVHGVGNESESAEEAGWKVELRQRPHLPDHHSCGRQPSEQRLLRGTLAPPCHGFVQSCYELAGQPF